MGENLRDLLPNAPPAYWGPATQVVDDVCALEDLSRDSTMMAQLAAYVTPGDAKQLGFGVDASGWSDTPKEKRCLKLRRAWRIQHDVRWADYSASIKEIEAQMKHIPEELRQPRLTRARPLPQHTDAAEWNAEAFAAATDALPGQLRSEVNETYLITGVPKAFVHKILMNGLNEGYAGSNAGTISVNCY
jgi:hypothetical protein